jgi:hypothetical protein
MVTAMTAFFLEWKIIHEINKGCECILHIEFVGDSHFYNVKK